jgi:hypothetical protein
MERSDLPLEEKKLLIEGYNKLNNSFKKVLVFHIGAVGGFFSEYNNMILAMLYCLKNKIRFVLYSEDANFKYESGWTDFFLPFCDEDRNTRHTKYNRRIPYTFKKTSSNKKADLIYNHFIAPVSKHRHLMQQKLAKIRYFGGANNIFFTYELWNFFHSKTMEKGFFKIDEMAIGGDVRTACRVLISTTWRYQPEIEMEIRKIIDEVCLPDKYIGLHIRGGDKIMEFELQELETYIEKARSLTTCRSAFILTDDYRIMEKLIQSFPDWQFFTLCERNSMGYFHDSFSKQDKAFKRKQHIKLFASIDILNDSELFIGTFNSNVGMFLGMRMPKDKSFGVDVDNWAIF